MAWRGRRLETVIDAGAHHVHLNARAVGHGRYARNHDSIRYGTEIDIEIFELGAPVRPERKFGAGAERPTARGGVLREARSPDAAGRRTFELDATECIAARDISEPAIGRIAKPAARRAKPVDVMFERGGRSAPGTLGCDAALGVAPVKIGFDAGNKGAGLPIEPALNAASRPPERSVGGCDC